MDPITEAIREASMRQQAARMRYLIEARPSPSMGLLGRARLLGGRLMARAGARYPVATQVGGAAARRAVIGAAGGSPMAILADPLDLYAPTVSSRYAGYYEGEQPSERTEEPVRYQRKGGTPKRR